MKKIGLACLLSILVANGWAHAPFVAPSNYVVEGGNTAILAGFAEQAFDSEVAIKGFNFKVLTPKGETQELTLSHSKALSLADVKTDQAGTYTVTGLRTGELKYAKVGQRWLRVLDAKAEDLAPLAERHFMTPSEVQAKTQQFTVQRFDQLLSYFSKQQYSAVKQDPTQQGLSLEFSLHPNQISLKTPFRVKLNLGNKAASGFQVTLEKQATTLGEPKKTIQLETNGSGEVTLPFSAVGEYLVTITSPEQSEKIRPNAQIYRTILSLYVNP
ncbi:DUF4198 domain-containing protein [Acinetobacter johnsonii]|uniref:DUF4198 domain-containing protein n=1 Tax=Acinetobacter johnsonii TaxID=40214 RepID=UPI0024472908|nr:DUF4198 domain-containing protein [Acinetobacter johnsonii]MDH1490031.1 DUF4198 domain-containing protein [Acinetobacter johnsonii]MDH1612990.1 DUF4198 domain-containing protein [Acinetobacter johnsonii]